jgi:AAA family ATP:ADP antiporter
MTPIASLPPNERLLNLFTEVRQGEAASALMLALNIFLILTAYYILKPVREALILSGSGGAEIKSYVAAKAPLGRSGAFRLVLQNRYLLLIIALLMLFLNWVNTTGEYILGRTVKEAAAALLAADPGAAPDEETFIGHFYADFFTVVNIAGLLLQLFVVSRVLKYLGVRAAIFILPLIALGGYLVAAFYPLLAMVRWVKTAENATDYSLQNTVRQVLFLPTTREQKYKAKQAIDTFFVRSGDVLSAALVFAGTTWFALTTRQFAMINILLVSAWLLLAFLVGREHRRLVMQPATHDPGKADGCAAT